MNKKIITAITAFSLLLCIMCSCSYNVGPQKSEWTTDESGYAMCKADNIVYDNKYFFTRYSVLRYCDIGNIDVGIPDSVCLDFDPLCEHNSSKCPAFAGSMTSMCVYPDNGVLYVYSAGSRLLTTDELKNSDTREVECISRYNILNCDYEILVDNVKNGIGRFLVYQNYIVYLENEGSKSTINVYDIDTGKTNVKNNDEGKCYSLIGVYDDKLYYNDNSCDVYCADFDLSGEHKIFTGKLSYGYQIYNSYLYFADNLSSQTVNGYQFNSVDYYRVSIADTGGSHELMAKNIRCYDFVYAYIFDGYLYYTPGSTSYLGQIKVVDDMGEMTFELYNEHDGILKRVNLTSHKDEEIFKDIGYNIIDILFASDDYIIFKSTGSGYRTDIEFDTYVALYKYYVSTDELIQFAYFGPQSTSDSNLPE